MSNSTKISDLDWLMTWYKNNCDGDWEHYYGIHIETLDNPGWRISIDLEGVLPTIEDQDWVKVENDEDTDWYIYKIENAKFVASGDPTKLGVLIGVFRKIVEQPN